MWKRVARARTTAPCPSSLGTHCHPHASPGLLQQGARGGARKWWSPAKATKLCGISCSLLQDAPEATLPMAHTASFSVSVIRKLLLILPLGVPCMNFGMDLALKTMRLLCCVRPHARARSVFVLRPLPALARLNEFVWSRLGHIHSESKNTLYKFWTFCSH